MEQAIWSVDAPLCAPCAVMLRKSRLYVTLTDVQEGEAECAWCEQKRIIGRYLVTKRG